MNTFKSLLIIAAAGLLAACAHPLVISPDPASLTTGSTKIEKNVGMVITPADKGAQVTTPGGGGDNVSYFPYKDLEFGLYSTLSSAFKNVVPLTSENDRQVIGQQNIDLIFVPSIQTASSSESMFTWPPTFFSIMIDYRVTDATGVQVTNGRVLGEGRAEFSEFKSDFALAARRAGTDAMNKLRDKLLSTEDIRK